MAHFIIENIGPITRIEFDLNRVNIFIGPQSVGKSTIAKIISFCLWLEKFTIRQQHVNNIDIAFMEDRLISFHKMKSYFRRDSHIKYEGTAINLEYFYQQKPIVEKKDGFTTASIGKVAYVPAERSLVSMVNVNSYKLEDDYVREFVFEWLSIHSKYSRNEAVRIPGTNVQYYFDSEKGDTVELDNNKTINLTESSSGLQSIIPLFMYCLYVSSWIYNHNADMSYKDMDKIIEGVSRKTYDMLKVSGDTSTIFQGDNYEDNAEIMLNLIRANLAHERETSSPDVYNILARIANTIRIPHFTQLIIEEPELNLFPETQVELLYAILKLMQNDRKDNLIITTHSPYMLYALNNCLLANTVRDKMPKAKFDKVSCSNILINPQDVSVYQLEDGVFRPIERNINSENLTIQDNDGLIRQNFFDNVMKRIMEDFNSLLRYRV